MTRPDPATVSALAATISETPDAAMPLLLDHIRRINCAMAERRIAEPEPRGTLPIE